MTALTLYFAPGSSSMAVHIALHEIGVPFEGRPLSFARQELRAPDYLALNPEGKVPALLIDGRLLTEVAAILYYLAKRFPAAALLPDGDLEAEAQALSWMSFCAATLHPARVRAARVRDRHLWRRRSATGQARLGARALFDRRHSSLPALLAARQFAASGARDFSQPRRAITIG